MCFKNFYLREFLFAILVASAVSTPVNASFFKDFDLSKLSGSSQEEQLLPDAEAFQIIQSEVNDGKLKVTWLSAPEYYLYRKNFKIVSVTDGVAVGEITLPKGDIEEDLLFGPVEVYFNEVEMTAPIIVSEAAKGLKELQFTIHAQGCNQPVGICYPPQARDVVVLNDNANLNVASGGVVPVESSAVSSPVTVEKSFWAYVFAAFGAGLLLVFTPCVLPMLPILSGLIIGTGEKPVSRGRAGALSIAYVIGTAITYTVMGALAGAAGIQLQAYFQHPVAIGVMAFILLCLALGMFGAFNLAMPGGVQSKLSQWTDKLKSGSLLLALIMGLLSALIVSACVSPLLITALGVAIQKGDPWLGGAMMFAMAMGMGSLLVAFGFGASWLVPKAGAWMNRVKELFGFAVLAVAIIVASSIKEVPLLMLWSAWLLGLGFWLWQMAQGNESSGKSIVIKVIAAFSFLWATAAFIGGLTGSISITEPLSKLSINNASNSSQKVKGMAFKKVETVAQIEALLTEAKNKGKPVLVDYYADWCTDCVRMDAGTYSEVEVIDSFDDWQLIKIDVTKVNEESQAAKDFFGVFGPPATLFVDSVGNEKKDLRRYGYMNKSELLDLARLASRTETSVDNTQ